MATIIHSLHTAIVFAILHRYFINIFIAFSESSKMIWITAYNLCILGAVTLTQSSVLKDVRSGVCEMIDHTYQTKCFKFVLE